MAAHRGESDIDLLVEFQPLEPSELVDAYFGFEEQLTDSLGTAVDLVMATARRNSIVQADIDATKQLIYAAGLQGAADDDHRFGRCHRRCRRGPELQRRYVWRSSRLRELLDALSCGEPA